MHPPYRQCLESPTEWPAELHPIKRPQVQMLTRSQSAYEYQSAVPKLHSILILMIGQKDMVAGIKPYSHLTAAFKPIFSSTHISLVLQGPAPNPTSSNPKTKNCLAELQLPSRPEKPTNPMGALPHSALPFLVSHVASLQCKHIYSLLSPSCFPAPTAQPWKGTEIREC